MMISGHKMVKKRLFRLELFCPSLPAILDEIPQLIFLCIIPLPVVISQLTGMYSLPVWLLWVAFLSGAYFWLSATLKFVRSVSKGKFRLTDSVAICLFLLLIPCATISKAFYSPIFGEDDNNAVNVMRNRWGRIVRRIERKDGKLNGLFMMDYDWGSVKGTYKNDIEIGKWVGWYPGKKQLLFEAFFDEDPEAITNRSGGVEFSPRLIDCTCYAPDGKVCGSVSNGVGCEVRYLPDNSIDFLKTYGYETN